MRLVQICFIALIFVSCGEVKRLDTSKIKEQMGNYKVKQIRPAEMMNQVRKLGQEGENAFNRSISCSDLDSVLQKTSKELNASIDMIDLSSISASDTEDEKEKMLYDAYLYAFENNEKLQSNAQKLANGTYVYSFGVNSDSLACDSLIVANRYFWKLTWSQAALIQSF